MSEADPRLMSDEDWNVLAAEPMQYRDWQAIVADRQARIEENEALLRVAKAARKLVDGMGMGTAGHLERLEDALDAWERPTEKT